MDELQADGAGKPVMTGAGLGDRRPGEAPSSVAFYLHGLGQETSMPPSLVLLPNGKHIVHVGSPRRLTCVPKDMINGLVFYKCN